ncbi:hypothetical protein L195_g011920, partial [Trifolium pratense]
MLMKVADDVFGESMRVAQRFQTLGGILGMELQGCGDLILRSDIHKGQRRAYVEKLKSDI